MKSETGNSMSHMVKSEPYVNVGAQNVHTEDICVESTSEEYTSADYNPASEQENIHAKSISARNFNSENISAENTIEEYEYKSEFNPNSEQDNIHAENVSAENSSSEYKSKFNPNSEQTMTKEENMNTEITNEEYTDYNPNSEETMTKEEILSETENSNTISEEKSGSKKRRKENTYEIEILESLVVKYGLNDLPKFDPSRSFVWKQIANEFNLNTGQNHDGKSLSKKYVNCIHYRRKKLRKNVDDFDEDWTPALEKRKYKEEFLSETENSNSMSEMKSRSGDDIEILQFLVEKSGLNDLPKFDTSRGFVWKQIAKQFNLTTGQNHDGKSLAKKYSNCTHYNRKKLLKNVEYINDGDVIPFHESAHANEIEILENLVEKSGINDLPKFDTSRGLFWKQIASEFNLKTGQNHDGKSISKKYVNMQSYNRKKLKNAENTTEADLVSAQDIAHAQEIEILESLVEKSGVNDLPKYHGSRGGVWNQIATEFNQNTGQNIDGKTLAKRYHHRHHYNRKKLIRKVEKKSKVAQENTENKMISNEIDFQSETLETMNENEEDDEENIDNPWSVSSIEQFLYFCCPECDVKDQSKESFIQHAFDEHPKAKKYLLKLKVKEEIYESDIVHEEYEEQDSSYLDYMTPICEIKSEIKDDNENSDDDIDNENAWHKSLKEFECDKCGQNFAWKKSLKTHKCGTDSSTLVEKTGNYTCFECSEEFTNILQLKKHIQVIHEKNNRERCDLCGKTYNSIHSLRKHHEKVHIENNATTTEKSGNNKCFICPKKFLNPWILKKHVESAHDNTCSECSKKFDSAWVLKRHIEGVHEKKNIATCDLCGKTYNHVSALKKHHRAVHQGIKDYVCTICSKGFSESTDLKDHIRCVHEGVKEHICDFCGMAFGMKSSLKGHIKNIHKQIKDHPCKFCDKAFSSYTRLKFHTTTTHEGIKKHKCLLCERRFVTPSKMRIHMKNVHPGTNMDLA